MLATRADPGSVARLALGDAIIQICAVWVVHCGHPFTRTCGRCHAYSRAIDVLLDTILDNTHQE